VFLSSHILSEVEALCDRVAILRAGDLIEAAAGYLDGLRRSLAGMPPNNPESRGAVGEWHVAVGGAWLPTGLWWRGARGPG